ncbi:hypothetical protein AK95_14485 [Paenibacillus sp. LC231]|uniref:DUF7210 family protein n=1 Tax=Paenibacillus sp. LC231 TaxID=1120679 RepID=UPI0008DD3DC3|nr:hypothetical protein [Paenibacillus sp. LC231]OIB04821.1 hypothetical protein AK95_14485 [Paenibacillus sp. LC231]
MNIKATGKIRHNGVDYKTGDVITGLSKKEYDRLINLNVGEEIDGGSEGDQEVFAGFQLNGDLLFTVDEFAGMKADDQKAHLKSLKIEPAGKEEDRIAQYEEWYADQVTADDQN